MTLDTFLTSAKSRLAAATPVKEVGHNLMGDTGHWATVRGLPTHSVHLANYFKIGDATFIASAPSDLAKALAVIECMRVYLDNIACWTEGERVMANFDEPGSASLAREALAEAERICNG